LKGFLCILKPLGIAPAPRKSLIAISPALGELGDAATADTLYLNPCARVTPAVDPFNSVTPIIAPVTPLNDIT